MRQRDFHWCNDDAVVVVWEGVGVRVLRAFGVSILGFRVVHINLGCRVVQVFVLVQPTIQF